MLNITQGKYRCCDGITRRSMLRAGALSFGGLMLNDWLRASAAANDAGKSLANKSVILIWQGGGPSHIDMWDLKPNSPVEYRGEYKPINSAIPGYQVCEHMPQIAKMTDRLTIVRACSHSDMGHESATHALLTGYKPSIDIPANETPSFGSIVGKEVGSKQPGFPAYVALPQMGRSMAASYLGPQYNAFEPKGNASEDNFHVRNLKPSSGITMDRFEKRLSLLKKFDTLRRDVDTSGMLAGMDGFTQQAWDLVTSPKVQEAFDITKEPEPVRERYGRKDAWGQNMLLARRLVEAGVRFVTVDISGWDTHINSFSEMRRNHLPRFDKAFSALIEDLDQRGRLADTLVFAWGEFGRESKINAEAGRHHGPNVFSVPMAGGGLKRGIVLGESDARAEQPKSNAVSPQDVLATMYHLLGIDRHKAYVNDANRPIEILNYGNPIAEILA